MPIGETKRGMTTLGILLVMALAAVWYFRGHKAVPEDETKLIQAHLTMLETSAKPDERLAAARFFGERPPLAASTDLQKLGNALLHDQDSRLRGAVANSIGASRRKLELHPHVRALNEPQVLELLLLAYTSEKDAAVRREIVMAAGEFNHAEAVTLINMALEDSDPAVAEEARRTKDYREQRLLKARVG